MTPGDVIRFWTEEVGEKRWFKTGAGLDVEIASRFGVAHTEARDGELADWEESAEGALALLLLLDQFPRNMFRGKAQAFATDARARGIAGRALSRGFDLETAPPLRPFFYLPFMHSENMADQDRSVALIAERVGRDSLNYPFALEHRDIVGKFGRFPGRNAALGRASTPEEIEFLRQPRRF